MGTVSASPTHPSASGHILVGAQPFAETLDFFTNLGFRLDKITPADDPAFAMISGFGLHLSIDGAITPTPLTLELATGARDSVTAPNGTVVNFVDSDAGEPAIPELVPELVISKAGDESTWGVGRAGMRYRDLIPSRLGGRFIASHIEVCDGGPVPDLVHHHGIRFQVIFCHRGWVEVVYENQGPPFRLEPGDAVLQPPHIRHRVLESSAGAQVVEIGCPAEHDTLFDYGVTLPTDTIDPDHDYDGQKFVRHETISVPWTPSLHPGFEVQHTAIAEATNGLADVRVIRSTGQSGTAPTRHDGEFWFLFVLDGSANFAVDGATAAAPLDVGDSVTIPAGLTWSLRDTSPDLALLEVVLPG